MATVVLDLDLVSLPHSMSGLERYSHALILIRFKQKPVGSITVPLAHGSLKISELIAPLLEATSWSVMEQWLLEYLEIDHGPASILSPTTVAICTRDRTEDLERCLNALLHMPDDGQEILVIDNAPKTNATQDLIQSHYPQVRYVRELRPGLDVARNRALKEAKYDLVAFTDDDAAPDPAWLRSLIHNFTDPTVMCVTGLTMPLELETEAQEWFERYSPFNKGFHRRVFDSTSMPNPLSTGRVGAGANMALRRSVIEKVGFFDEALDAGTPTCSGGDHEFFARLLINGYRIVYEPSALSWHRHRRTWPELQRVLYGYGVGVYSLLTAFLLKREFSVVKIAYGWFKYEQLPNLVRSLRKKPGAVPLDLILWELRGCLTGPWAYLSARRNLQKTLIASTKN